MRGEKEIDGEKRNSEVVGYYRSAEIATHGFSGAVNEVMRLIQSEIDLRGCIGRFMCCTVPLLIKPLFLPTMQLIV